MLWTEDNTIKVRRGNRGTFTVQKIDDAGNIENFEKDDKVIFSVKENFSNSDVLIRKIIQVEETCNEVVIELTKKDTTIGNLIAKPKTYQYDICVNEDETILGYDDAGAKEFILYPEGSNDE